MDFLNSLSHNKQREPETASAPAGPPVSVAAEPTPTQAHEPEHRNPLHGLLGGSKEPAPVAPPPPAPVVAASAPAEEEPSALKRFFGGAGEHQQPVSAPEPVVAPAPIPAPVEQEHHTLSSFFSSRPEQPVQPVQPTLPVPVEVVAATTATTEAPHHGISSLFTGEKREDVKKDADVVIPPPVPVVAPAKVEEHGFLFGVFGHGKEPIVAAAPPPAPPVAAPAPAPEHEHSILDHLRGTPHPAAAPVPVAAPPPPAPAEPESLLDKLSHLGHSASPPPPPAPAPAPVVPAVKEEEEHDILSRLSNYISPAPAAPPPAPVEPEDKDLLARLSSHISHPAPAPVPEEPKHRHEVLLEKLSLHSEPEPAPAPEHHSINPFHREPVPPPEPESLKDRLLHHREKADTSKMEETGFKNKMHEMIGVKSEANEDHLDKTIDFVQEHLLHQGPQKDESTVERLKDAQIASAIRHAIPVLDHDEDKKKHKK